MNVLAPKSRFEIKELTPSAGYERLLYCQDEVSGLKALISIHSTKFGPAAGGCRMWPFASIDEAIGDVERLSRGMTYKNIAANLPLGGGKAVIIGDAAKDKSPRLLRAFAKFLDHLKGSYFTAEDVGISPLDLEIVARETPYVAGLHEGEFASGDPSPVTAHGVFLCLEHSVKFHLHKTNLQGLSVAIQGLGQVGMALANLLHQRGAELIVCDVNPDRRAEATKQFGAEIVAFDSIYDADSDVFAPCALGGILTPETISRLNAGIVVGAANNQLAMPDCGRLLHEAGILYAPDYVVNGGGIINVATEILRIKDPLWREQRVNGLVVMLDRIFKQSVETNTPTNFVADLMIETKLEAANA